MGQRIITVRVRPPRGLLLIDSAAPPIDLVKIIRFLTQIWGGRYYPIIPVNSAIPDELTLFRLKDNRPDYVFSFGIHETVWRKPIEAACQPREYSLDPSVRNSLNEGLATVVLTGRFLENLSHSGFFWLPGVKYRKKPDSGDIDIIASCDGDLVFGECKSLADTPHDAETWGPVVDQFLETASVAIECHGYVAVLAAMVHDYPLDVSARIEKELSGKIPYLLLARPDLEAGFRRDSGTKKPHMRLESLLPTPSLEKQNKLNGDRIIRMGGMTYTKKGQQ